MKIVVAIAVVIVVFLLLVVIIRKRVKQRDEIIKRMEYFSGVGQRGGELGGLNQSIDDVPKVYGQIAGMLPACRVLVKEKEKENKCRLKREF